MLEKTTGDKTMYSLGFQTMAILIAVPFLAQFFSGKCNWKAAVGYAYRYVAGVAFFMWVLHQGGYK
ncbi:hypothetical protein IPJ70_03265 [Candidatus Campbellbacteria bacterium]|nr:MAG: hypothetical protein IPJ70_03265 [Candidatus Campbellbacteria bacterium]